MQTKTGVAYEKGKCNPLKINGFGVLVVSMLASVTGSNPAEAGRKNPRHAFLQRGSKAVCPMSQICGV
jgi:hypothetical protein